MITTFCLRWSRSPDQIKLLKFVLYYAGTTDYEKNLLSIFCVGQLKLLTDRQNATARWRTSNDFIGSGYNSFERQSYVVRQSYLTFMN